MKVWDVENDDPRFNYPIYSNPTALEWNYDGELLACATRDHMLHIYDPRDLRKSLTIETGLDGAMHEKFKWIGNTGQILTIGSTRYDSCRYYSIFDMRYIK